MHQLTQQLHLDLNWRFVNNINVETQPVASYHELDARLAWEVGHGLELAVVGRNLINDHHQEFGSVFFSMPTAIQREVYATVRWNF
jgi:iron complex outermembrane receptor protein